jgi:hypothetical protein
MLQLVVWEVLTDISDKLCVAFFTLLMMEVVSLYQVRRHKVSEDSPLLNKTSSAQQCIMDVYGAMISIIYSLGKLYSSFSPSTFNN